MRRSALDAGKSRHGDWLQRFAAYEKEHAELAEAFRRPTAGWLREGWRRALPSFEPETQLATRSASGTVLNAIAAVLLELVGGSADLAPSTDTYLKGFADVSCGDFSGATSTSACGSTGWARP